MADGFGRVTDDYSSVALDFSSPFPLSSIALVRKIFSPPEVSSCFAPFSRTMRTPFSHGLFSPTDVF